MMVRLAFFCMKRCLTYYAPAQLNLLSAPRCVYRTNSTNAAAETQPIIDAPPLDDTKIYEPKIVNIVDSISQLTLREVVDLNELLKTTLNIKDIAVAAPTAMAGPAAGVPESEEEKAPQRDEFSVKLVAFAAADKIKLIKALKVAKPELNLVQAKKFVESVPQMVIEAASKEDCENMKKALEEAGGKIEIV